MLGSGPPFAPSLVGRPGEIEALYVIHFNDVSSSEMRNGGVIVLETRRGFGGDSGAFYVGSYEISGRMLRAKATVRFHDAEWENVWGDDAREFEVCFEGKCAHDNSEIIGKMWRTDKNNVPISVKLIRVADLP